jgi:hypothetical protein
MKVIAFQAKAALLSKEGDTSFFRMFFGLKSRIFITAEFILRHESPSETCLKGSTFICRKDAKSASSSEYHNPCTAWNSSVNR